MAAPKRSRDQVLRDRADIARLYLQGWTQQCIGERLEMTRQMVSYDLGRIREAWINSALVDFDEARSRELAKIDNLECEHWEAWARSREDRVTETARTESGGTSGDKVTDTTKTEYQVGDPRFLEGVAWCIGERCKLLGLYEPEKFALVDDWRKQAEEAGIDRGTASTVFENLVAAAAEAFGQGHPTDGARGDSGGAETD